MLRRILNAAAESGYRVRLTFDDGDTVCVDFGPVAAGGGIFTPLGDPDFFSQVRVEEGGRVLAWPGELEFCADALWLQTHAAPEKVLEHV